MVTTLSRQARRYPQMRSGFSLHQQLVALGEAALSATLTGTWSKVIACHSDQPRITIAAKTKTGELHGGSGTVEI